jgi:ankyrin repeat protein
MGLDEELLDAAWDGDTARVKELLRKGANVNAKSAGGSTPLHYAAFWGYVDVAKLLLDHGADVNARDDRGWTPLHFAAAEGRAGVARLLLERGALASFYGTFLGTFLFLILVAGFAVVLIHLFVSIKVLMHATRMRLLKEAERAPGMVTAIRPSTWLPARGAVPPSRREAYPLRSSKNVKGTMPASLGCCWKAVLTPA